MARGTPVSERIVRRVAEATDSDVSELPTLYDAIDPEGLDALVARMSNGVVSFSYAGHEVTVDSDGSISVDGACTGAPATSVAAGDS